MIDAIYVDRIFAVMLLQSRLVLILWDSFRATRWPMAIVRSSCL